KAYPLIYQCFEGCFVCLIKTQHPMNLAHDELEITADLRRPNRKVADGCANRREYLSCVRGVRLLIITPVAWARRLLYVIEHAALCRDRASSFPQASCPDGRRFAMHDGGGGNFVGHGREHPLS